MVKGRTSRGGHRPLHPPPPSVLFKAWLCGNSFMQSAPVCLNVTGHDVPLSSSRTEWKNWTYNPTGPDGRNLDLLKDVWANYNFFFHVLRFSWGNTTESSSCSRWKRSLLQHQMQTQMSTTGSRLSLRNVLDLTTWSAAVCLEVWWF